MALPIQATPVYTMTIPSTKETIRYRPFLVREEKALMMAQISDDVGVMYDTVKEVLRACIKDSVKLDNLSSFDIEYMFVKLRTVSVGETSDLLFQCDNCVDDEKARARVRINLNNASVVTPEGHDKKVELYEKVGVMMKYPSIDVLRRLDTEDTNDVDVMFDIISQCIEYIYDAENIYRAEDTSKQELIDFMTSLTSEQFGKLQTFFRTMPSLRMDVEYRCPVCGLEHKKYIQGISSFF